MFGKPVSKMSKMNVLVETCAALTKNGKNDIGYDALIAELMATKKFHEN